MVCERIMLPGGQAAIVCSSTPRASCECGRPGTQLCDWKVPSKRSGTCDAAICDRCTTSPAEDKDLCPTHASAFAEWKAARSAAGPAPSLESDDGN